MGAGRYQIVEVTLTRGEEVQVIDWELKAIEGDKMDLKIEVPAPSAQAAIFGDDQFKIEIKQPYIFLARDGLMRLDPNSLNLRKSSFKKFNPETEQLAKIDK